MDYPINAPDDPVINLGIGITNISADQPLQGAKLIASTIDRRPAPPALTEDMTYGTNGDITGINTSEIKLSDNALFNAMTSLFHKCTILDQSGLKIVGDNMMAKFRAKNGGQFSDPVLNGRVALSAQYQNFIQKFGGALNTSLHDVNGDITKIGKLTVDRPTFNGTYNKFHGLQILIDDTEYTEIQITNYTHLTDGHWSATIDITIYDDFGLDRNDVLTYQTVLGINTGFADWWLLQHTRGYVPFTTVVHVRSIITAKY